MVKQYHLSSIVVTHVNTVENRLCLYTSWPYKNQSGGGGGGGKRHYIIIPMANKLMHQ